MQAPFLLNHRDPSRGLFHPTKLQGKADVHHYDVIDFDVLSYWGQHRTWVPGEDLRVVRCYASYERQHKQVTICSFPEQLVNITDNLTKDRAKYCHYVGNLFEDDELLAELQQTPQQVSPPFKPLYEFQVARKGAGYLAHAYQYKMRVSGKDLHQLREKTYQALDLHLAKTGGPFLSPLQVRFVLQ